ncbi:hypothetical protein [Actinoplanes sp. NPDC051411]|uniref:hypothetical protein n=1 Tax=Actinoplanes sp. NPDC051411 TaxID=3155522 RepID=UPI0034457DA5
MLDDLHLGAADEEIDIHDEKKASPPRIAFGLAVNFRPFDSPSSSQTLSQLDELRVRFR